MWICGRGILGVLKSVSWQPNAGVSDRRQDSTGCGDQRHLNLSMNRMVSMEAGRVGSGFVAFFGSYAYNIEFPSWRLGVYMKSSVTQDLYRGRTWSVEAFMIGGRFWQRCSRAGRGF